MRGDDVIQQDPRQRVEALEAQQGRGQGFQWKIEKMIGADAFIQAKSEQRDDDDTQRGNE